MVYRTPFKSIIPALKSDEYELLESSILTDGCRDAIVLWGDIIIDGHNRYEICLRHGIEYTTINKEFADNDEAKLWIIKNQFGRRNISSFQRSELALQMKAIIAEQAKERQGTRTDIVQNSAPSFGKVRDELARIAGVSHDTIHRTEAILAKAPEPVIEKVRQGEISINQAYNTVRKQEAKEIREHLPKPELPVGKYQVIYADPPWQYNDRQNTPCLGGAEKHYATMSIDELCKLPINQIGADNSVLFIWVTSPLLEDVFRVINSWGYEYKTSFVWDKVKHNMGHYNSVRHELLLVATKGQCLPDHVKLYDSVQTVERTEHSKKPDIFYEIIETLYSGSKIELFARRPRHGWHSWGNEIND